MEKYFCRRAGFHSIRQDLLEILVFLERQILMNESSEQTQIPDCRLRRYF